MKLLTIISLILASQFLVSQDTLKAVLLVTACTECPAHSTSGYVVETAIKTKFLDENKKPFKSGFEIWGYKLLDKKKIEIDKYGNFTIIP